MNKSQVPTQTTTNTNSSYLSMLDASVISSKKPAVNSSPYELYSSLELKSSTPSKINKPQTNTAVDKSISFQDIRNGAFMKLGDSGGDVANLQKKLSALGFRVQATGTFGNTTKTVVKDFQRKAGLEDDGIVGVKTLRALERAESTPTVKSVPVTTSGIKLAKTAERIATNRSTFGWCYSAAADSIARATKVYLYGESAYMASNQLVNSGKFKEIEVKQNELPKLKPGTVVVWGKTKASPHGHISVALGNGKEASDHVTKQLTNLRGYTNYRVFVPVA